MEYSHAYSCIHSQVRLCRQGQHRVDSSSFAPLLFISLLLELAYSIISLKNIRALCHPPSDPSKQEPLRLALACSDTLGASSTLNTRSDFYCSADHPGDLPLCALERRSGGGSAQSEAGIQSQLWVSAPISPHPSLLQIPCGCQPTAGERWMLEALKHTSGRTEDLWPCCLSVGLGSTKFSANGSRFHATIVEPDMPIHAVHCTSRIVEAAGLPLLLADRGLFQAFGSARCVSSATPSATCFAVSYAWPIRLRPSLLARV